MKEGKWVVDRDLRETEIMKVVQMHRCQISSACTNGASQFSAVIFGFDVRRRVVALSS